MLDKGGQDALDALKKLFGGSNLSNTIRNSYAFHHPHDADTEAAFELATASSELDDEWDTDGCNLAEEFWRRNASSRSRESD